MRQFRFLVLVPILLLAMLPRPAYAGPNAGGTLILHAEPDTVVYNQSLNYCGHDSLAACSLAVVSVPAVNGTTRVFHVYAVFPDSSSPSLSGLTFGIQYGPALQLVGSGTCGDFELVGTGWPQSDTGTSVTWDTPQTGHLIPVYWFAGYFYSYTSPDSAIVTLIPHPEHDGNFGSSALPAELDSIAAYGTLGFGAAGSLPCPPPAPNEEPSQLPDQDTHEPEYDNPAPTAAPTTHYVLSIRTRDITFHPLCAYPLALNDVSFTTAVLHDSLYSHGAVSISKSFPGKTPADTVVVNPRGDTVRVPDLSAFYHVCFPDSLALVHARVALLSSQAVTVADLMPHTAILATAPVNDAYFDSVPNYFDQDAQWFLENDGARTSSGPETCLPAESGYDIGIATMSSWSSAILSPWATIGILDTGVLNSHEDLHVVAELHSYPNVTDDYFGVHGTRMAGLAAALTNNYIGVAGVCPNCSIMDIVGCESEFGFGGWLNWADGILPAAETPIAGGQLVSLNMSLGFPFAPPNYSPPLETVLNLWTSKMAHWVIPVASSGNVQGNSMSQFYPACIPFVIAVGGSTWSGRFWDRYNTCTPQGYHSARGYNLVDICAPASGSAFTTEPFLQELPDKYWYTEVMSSGACAQVSGACAFLQAIAHSQYGEQEHPEIVEGVLEAAALPFAVDPTSAAADPSCPSCPRDWYGHGLLNVRGAARLLEIMHEPSPGGTLYTRYITAANSEMTITTDGEPFAYADKLWQRYRVTVALIVAPNPLSEPLLPPRIAFVTPNLLSSGWHAGYFDFQDPGLSVAAATEGIHGCDMGVIDQVTGEVAITTWLYEFQDNGNWQWLETTPWNLCIPVWLYGDVTAVTAGSKTACGLRVAASLTNGRERGTLRLYSPQGGDGHLHVFDAAGRELAEIALGQLTPGGHVFSFDVRHWANGRVARGIYLIKAIVGAEAAVTRLIIVQ
jgi:hypothetical protein